MLLKGMLDSAIMKSGSNGNKFWVIDVDSEDETIQFEIVNKINTAQSGHDYNIIECVETVHGVHLITHPFDTRVLEGTGVEAKKEGLTLLYAYLNE